MQSFMLAHQSAQFLHKSVQAIYHYKIFFVCMFTVRLEVEPLSGVAAIHRVSPSKIFKGKKFGCEKYSHNK